ncbi:MAG TPA: GNAT family N-acetyltransferase [Stellaceae bacterium]|jgi:ribosomal-protein-alanine N-acetyltransferase|nr:GNAT family N-acetyltransferase [Stellaceae bacterium]
MTSRIEPLPHGAAGAISLLHRVCFPEDPWDARAIEQIMGIPGFFGRVGWTKTVPVAFALTLALGDEAEIVSLGVLPDHRRCGIGSAILDAVCGEARLRGAERVLLEMASDNEAARALYAGRGFTVVGRRRNYYRQAERLVDALILRVQLPAASPAP